MTSKKLAKLINCNQNSRIEDIDLKAHANDVQAVLINPPWDCMGAKASGSKSKNKNSIGIADFNKLKIPSSVMKDGLIFIWVEKELISDIIKFMENQDIQYVENVCYIMLD